MVKNILIVDDSATLRASLLGWLSDQGYSVFQAVDGIDGLNKIEKIKSRGLTINLIITDINMPNMNGIEFIKAVKKTDQRSVPLIILSTVNDRMLKDQAKFAGAIGWMTKPFKKENLIQIVEKYIH